MYYEMQSVVSCITTAHTEIVGRVVICLMVNRRIC